MKNLIHDNHKKIKFIENNEGKLHSYIGKKSDYYLDKFQAEHNKFSWPAFFLGPLWFGYRQMYLESFLVGLTRILILLIFFMISHFPIPRSLANEEFIELFLRTGNKVSVQILLNVVYPVILGIVANYLYFHSLERRILERKERYGISWYGVLVGAIVGIILPIVLASLILSMVITITP